MRRAVLVGVVMAVAVLSASEFAWAATVSFAPAVNYEVGRNPIDVASADFDGD